MKTYFAKRLKRLQKSLSNHKMAAFLVTNPTNIAYLTGVLNLSSKYREIILLITPQEAISIISPLKIHQFPKSLGFQIIKQEKHVLKSIINRLLKAPITKLNIEAEDLHVSELNQLKQQLKIKITCQSNIIEQLRLIKDNFEIKSIKRACHIAALTWKKIKPQIKPGMTEASIAAQIEKTIKQLGASGFPQFFPPIVASGPNSAIPHHQTTSRKIKPGDIVLIDFGCTVNGYCSDMSRTIVVGRPTPQQSTIMALVKKAYHLGQEALITTSKPQIIDQKVRQFFTNQGYHQAILHTSGHGIGLDIHELPSLAISSKNLSLKPGMVIALEPGIYLPKKFGVRHENTLLITKAGYQLLTQ